MSTDVFANTFFVLHRSVRFKLALAAEEILPFIALNF